MTTVLLLIGGAALGAIGMFIYFVYSMSLLWR